MRNYFLIQERTPLDNIVTLIDSRDYGVYISGAGTWSAPARKYGVVDVPGKNGSLLAGSRAFENGIVTYADCFVSSDFETNIDAFRADIMSLYGYAELHDSYHPDFWRDVYIPGGFDPVVEPDQKAGTFTLEFACRPQKWLASGLEITDLASAPSLPNPTRFIAKPMIYVWGSGKFKWVSTGKSLHALGYEDYNQEFYVHVSRAGPHGPVCIDAETMLCYAEGSGTPDPYLFPNPVNWGEYVKITSDSAGDVPAYDFPEIRSGSCWADESTVTKIEVKPRWWTL